MRARPGLLAAPAGLAGCGAAIAIGGVPPLGAVAWVAVGVALALSIRCVPRAFDPGMEELERHLMRCRRRGESASVLVAHVPASGLPDPERLSGGFRLTDSVTVARTPRGYELAGVFDDGELDRATLERRLCAAAGLAGTSLAWKRFPDDGVTLPVLIDAARAELADSTAVEPAAIVPPVFDGAPATSAAESK